MSIISRSLAVTAGVALCFFAQCNAAADDPIPDNNDATFQSLQQQIRRLAKQQWALWPRTTKPRTMPKSLFGKGLTPEQRRAADEDLVRKAMESFIKDAPKDKKAAARALKKSLSTLETFAPSEDHDDNARAKYDGSVQTITGLHNMTSEERNSELIEFSASTNPEEQYADVDALVEAASKLYGKVGFCLPTEQSRPRYRKPNKHTADGQRTIDDQLCAEVEKVVQSDVYERFNKVLPNVNDLLDFNELKQKFGGRSGKMTVKEYYDHLFENLRRIKQMTARRVRKQKAEELNLRKVAAAESARRGRKKI